MRPAPPDNPNPTLSYFCAACTAAEYPNKQTSYEQKTEYLHNSVINILLRRISIPNAICRSVVWEHTVPVIMFPIRIMANDSLSCLGDILDRSRVVIGRSILQAECRSITIKYAIAGFWRPY